MAVDRREPPRVSVELAEVLNDMPEDSRVARWMVKLVRQLWHDLALHAQDNGERLDRSNRTVKTILGSVTAWMVVMTLILAGVGVATWIVLSDQSGEAQRIQAAEQTSRYDSSYSACQKTNARHTAALSEAQPLTRLNPAAGALAIDLINTLAPLRDGQDGHLSCATYAAQQTALHIPAPFAPPPK